MAGLVLKLAPNERVLINGVVMENGDRKTTLKIKTPQASILRLRDALHPDDATTAVTRAYYVAQLAVAGTLDGDAAFDQLATRLGQLAHAFAPAPKHAEAVKVALENLRKRNFYALMRSLHPLIAAERELLAAGFNPAPANADDAPLEPMPEGALSQPAGRSEGLPSGGAR
ncbi:MAG: flagellar biosynthesis repressor FlbT [Pseudomonadota bacterium]